MSEQTPTQNTTTHPSFVVNPPFHSDSPGDCIIQTADGTQFVVYRVILALASSVWNDMFSLPQASDGAPAEHPIIPVDEDPETMEILLTMLYPMEPPHIKSYDLAIKLVQACDKYFINTARLSTFLHDILRTTEALETDPLGVYVLAWRLQMEEEVKIASRYTHRLDLYDKGVMGELVRRAGGLNAAMALWDLRRRREAALDDVAKLMELDETPFACPSHPNNTYRASNLIVSEYLKVRVAVKAALENPYPACKTLQQFFGRPPASRRYNCTNCDQASDRKQRELIASATEAIEKYPQTIERLLR